MAQIDARIPLMARGPDIEPIQNQLYNATRLQSAQGQLQDAQQERGQRNALMDVLRQPGTFSPEGQFNRSSMSAIAQASPGSVPGFAQIANQQEDQQMQRAKYMVEQQAQLLGSVNDEASYQRAKQIYAGMGGDPSKLPPNYDPAFVQQALRSSMTAAQQFDQQYRNASLDLQKQRLSADKSNLSAPIQTSQGFAQADREGNVRLLQGPDGKPLMPVAIDATGQGAVAQAKAQGTAQGKAQAENEQSFGQVEATANQIMGTIDKAIGHPGRDLATGISSVLPIIPGTDVADFNAVLDQIKGQTFLQAFESLKGGGVITDIEGQKATQAIARLERSQSKEAFVESLNDLRNIVSAGVERARQKAGPTAGGASQPDRASQLDSILGF